MLTDDSARAIIFSVNILGYMGVQNITLQSSEFKEETKMPGLRRKNKTKKNKKKKLK